MLVFALLGVVAIVAFAMFALAANVGGRGMLALSLVVLLIGAGMTLLSINALSEAQAAPVITHHQSPYSVKHEKPMDWQDMMNDPYFMVFGGIVIAIWGVAGCIGYGFAKE